MRVRLLLAVLLLVPFLLAGCQLRQNMLAAISAAKKDGIVITETTLIVSTKAGVFASDGEVVTLVCGYKIIGMLNGKPVARSSMVTEQAKGNKGEKYDLKCDDPLIAQFPADAVKFHAIALKGHAKTVLPVKPGLGKVPIAPGRHLTAAHGRQLVLIAAPAHMTGTFMLVLTFKLARARSISVKPFFAGQVICHGGAFYPPEVPLVTRISAVPSVSLPVASGPVPVPLNVKPVHSGKVLVDCR